MIYENMKFFGQVDIFFFSFYLLNELKCCFAQMRICREISFKKVQITGF